MGLRSRARARLPGPVALSSLESGTCFGFQIRSQLSFEFLRGGSGETLEVAQATEPSSPEGDLLFDWAATGDLPHTRLFQHDGGYRYWVDGGGWFLVEPAIPRVTVPAEAEPLRREERLWSLPLLLCFAARGDLPLHAAAVDIGGSAVLIAAPRTFGKTTLAAGFLAAGHRVLSEDIACLRVRPDPQVIPGPAMLRVRADVAERLEFRDARAVGRDEMRLHLALAPHSRGTCDPVPLRAIVLLRESEDGRPRLDRVNAANALPDLWELGFRLLGAAPVAASFDALADLVAAVPVWNLFRPLRLDRLNETVEAVLAGI